MKAYWRLVTGQESRHYARWRLRQGIGSFLRFPAEWLILILQTFARKLEKPAPLSHASFEPSDNSIRPDFKKFLFTPDDVGPQAERNRVDFPGEIAEILRVADRLTAGYVPLLAGNEYHWSPGHWKLQARDSESVYSLHRWTFAMVLGKAWAYGREARTLATFQALVKDWEACHPPDAEQPAWQSYNVSERMVNTCYAAAFFWDAPSFQEKTLPLLTSLLGRHAEFLSNHLETHQAHNHLINNARALYFYGSLFDQGSIRTHAWKILCQEFSRQTTSEGFLEEQSIPYHLLLTRTALEVVLVASHQGDETSGLTRNLIAMLNAAVTFIRPDGSVPLVGDVSPDIPLHALVGAVSAGCAAMQQPTPYPVPINEYGSWLLTQHHTLPSQPTNEKRAGPMTSLPQSGFQIYNTPQVHLTFYADPRAEVVRHGHADALSTTLWANGADILLDSGIYAYASDDGNDYFRGPKGHNILSLDDLPPYPVTDFLAAFYSPEYRRSRSYLRDPMACGKFWKLEGGHSGYERLGDPIQSRRRLMIGTDYFWATDWIEGARTAHSYESTWHWNGTKNRRIRMGHWEIHIGPNQSVQAAWLLNGTPIDPQWNQAWTAPDYGQKKATMTSILKGQLTTSIRLDLWVGLKASVQLFEFAADRDRKGLIKTSQGQDEFE